jgi:hypothetical protein
VFARSAVAQRQVVRVDIDGTAESGEQRFDLTHDCSAS